MRSAGQTEAKRRAGNAGGRPVTTRIVRQDVPEVPPTLGPAGQRAWVELWSTGSWLTPDKHRQAMTILCRNFDERETYENEWRKHPFVKGSMGQRRVNPAADYKLKVEASIRSWLKELGYFDHVEQDTGPNDLDAFLGGFSS
jgi:hypothetical protein